MGLQAILKNGEVFWWNHQASTARSAASHVVPIFKFLGLLINAEVVKLLILVYNLGQIQHQV